MINRLYGDYPDMTGVRRVLVIVLKNIGDVVLSSPVFGVLKHAMPECTVDAFVNSGTEDILAGNPDIGRVLVLDRKALKKGAFSRLREEVRLARAVRFARYDMTIALSSGSRSRNTSFLSGAGIRLGAASSKKEGMFRYTIPVNMAPAKRHYLERNLDFLRRIGIFPEEGLRRPVFFEGDGAQERVRKLLSKTGVAKETAYMVVHPTSRWMFKCWPYEKVAGLIDKVQRELGVQVVLTAGPDAAEKEYVVKLLQGLSTEVIDFSGILSLRELGALIRGARLFFGVDSAPMHISAATGTPAVALFGPTSAYDWAPWGEGHRVITSPAHQCVPCGRDGCGGSKVSDCLFEIGVDTVFSAVKERLEGGTAA